MAKFKTSNIKRNFQHLDKIKTGVNKISYCNSVIKAIKVFESGTLFIFKADICKCI